MMTLYTYDRDVIREGTAILREALTLGRVTIERIREQQARDIETVRVREYWGDRNEQQQVITQGIKLRIAARELLFQEQPARSTTNTQSE